MCYKVMMIEKNDEVVEIHSSLMSGVARKALGKINYKDGSDFFISKD